MSAVVLKTWKLRRTKSSRARVEKPASDRWVATPELLVEDAHPTVFLEAFLEQDVGFLFPEALDLPGQ
jgi:hypothetical protein